MGFRPIYEPIHGMGVFRISGQLFFVFLFTPWLHLHRLHRSGLYLIYFLLHFHSFDGTTDVNVLAFMCLELMGHRSWGGVGM